MEKNKKTKKELFAEVLAVAAVAENAELKAFVEHEVELLNKKTDNKKPTKAQEENEIIKGEVVEALVTAGKAVTISELQETAALTNYTNQKLSALIKQLVDEGKVIRTEVKRKAYFEAAVE